MTERQMLGQTDIHYETDIDIGRLGTIVGRAGVEPLQSRHRCNKKKIDYQDLAIKKLMNSKLINLKIINIQMRAFANTHLNY